MVCRQMRIANDDNDDATVNYYGGVIYHFMLRVTPIRSQKIITPSQKKSHRVTLSRKIVTLSQK